MQSNAKATRPLPPLPRWRWWLYLGAGVLVFSVIFFRIGGEFPGAYPNLDTWLNTNAAGAMIVSGIFTGLIMALVKLFLDPVFLGIAQHRSKLAIAADLAETVAETAVGVAFEGVLSSGGGSGRSSGSSGSGSFAGGGGGFSGGGASGSY